MNDENNFCRAILVNAVECGFHSGAIVRSSCTLFNSQQSSNGNFGPNVAIHVVADSGSLARHRCLRTFSYSFRCLRRRNDSL